MWPNENTPPPTNLYTKRGRTISHKAIMEHSIFQPKRRNPIDNLKCIQQMESTMTRVELENIVPPSPHPTHIPSNRRDVCGRGGTQFPKLTDSTQKLCPSQICVFTQMIYDIIYFINNTHTTHFEPPCARARPASCEAPVNMQCILHIAY